MAKDELELRNAFFSQSEMHDSLSTAVGGVWFVAFWPALYKVSRMVKPASCGVFTLAWAYSYYKGINPFLASRLQAGLNSTAAPYVKKYGIKTDEDYLQ